MKQLYLLIYILIQKIGAEILDECSECGEPLSVIQIWTDNSTVWRRETFTSECGSETFLTCSRTEHLKGDLYVMLFKDSPDLIGINPFFVNKTLSYNMKTKIVCKQGRWFHEDINTPISHALCDQFINPSLFKNGELTKNEGQTVGVTATEAFVTEQPVTVTATEAFVTEQPQPETTTQPNVQPEAKTEKIKMLQSAVELYLTSNIRSKKNKTSILSSPALSNGNINEDATSELITPPKVLTTLATIHIRSKTTPSPVLKSIQSLVTMSDRRESLEDRPFPQQVLDATLNPGYEDPIVTTTTSEPLSLTPGTSFILFNGPGGTFTQSRKPKVQVHKIKAPKQTRQSASSPHKRTNGQPRRRPQGRNHSKKNSRSIKQKIHRIQHQ